MSFLAETLTRRVSLRDVLKNCQQILGLYIMSLYHKMDAVGNIGKKVYYMRSLVRTQDIPSSIVEQFPSVNGYSLIKVTSYSIHFKDRCRLTHRS